MCDKHPLFKILDMKLKLTLSETEYNDRIKKYKNACAVCGNDSDCLKQARTNLSRGVDIYPWTNYDWDYGSYVDNNYSAKATGSDPRNMRKNFSAFGKIAGAYITDPNPREGSTAGGKNISDRNSDFPVYGCEGNREESCKKLWAVRQMGNSGVPYEDKFFKQFPVEGVNASSFYFKVGACNRPDKKIEADCVSKGYKWKNGACYQDRYAYMDNRGGIKPLRGFVPSLTTDIASFSPNFILDAWNGKSSAYMKVQECPVIEGFENSSKYSIWVLLFVGVILLGFSNNRH
jgi:hypothetical protein